jgi:hypothetical protein
VLDSDGDIGMAKSRGTGSKGSGIQGDSLVVLAWDGQARRLGRETLGREGFK